MQSLHSAAARPGPGAFPMWMPELAAPQHHCSRAHPSSSAWGNTPPTPPTRSSTPSLFCSLQCLAFVWLLSFFLPHPCYSASCPPPHTHTQGRPEHPRVFNVRQLWCCLVVFIFFQNNFVCIVTAVTSAAFKKKTLSKLVNFCAAILILKRKEST